MELIPPHEVPIFVQVVERWGPDLLAAEDLVQELGVEEFEAWDDLYAEHAYVVPPMPLRLMVNRLNALTTATQTMEVLAA